MASLILTARRALGVTVLAAAAGGYAGQDVIASIRTESRIEPPRIVTSADVVDAPTSVASRDEDNVSRLGRISGDCTPLKKRALDHGTRIERVIDIEFPQQVRIDDLDRMAPSALTLFTEMQDDANPYGEAVSFDALSRCVDASLVKTRSMLQVRDRFGARPDYVASLAGHKVGVTVARAYDFPRGPEQAVSAAHALVTTQLGEIRASTANARGRYRWRKPVLFVLSDSKQTAAAVERAWDELPDEGRGETMLWVAVTRGDDGFVYGEPLSL